MAMIFQWKSLCYVFLLSGLANVGVLGGRSESHGINHDFFGGQTCLPPRLDLHHPDIMKFVKETDPLVCSDVADWVQINGSVAFITKEAKQKYGSIECFFKDIIRVNDDKTYFGVATKVHNEYHLKNSDFVAVNCISEKGNKWENVMAGIRQDWAVLNRTGWNRKDGLQLNVLIWGYDSLSRNMFALKLPKTHRYMHETLDAIELQGYNIVGDGTVQALIPILTGYVEEELPKTDKYLEPKAPYVNVYPFIWNAFRDHGYVTGFEEGCTPSAVFNNRMKGFNVSPTDHYMRPFCLEVLKVMPKHRWLCLGSVPRHKVMMNYIHNFFNVYRDKPKFIFGFVDEISHDDFNIVNVADEDNRQWLQKLYDEGHLNSTLLIIMTDHGPRFSAFRDTVQGKLEERLPMFSLMVPKWFRRAYPAAFDNLRRNIMRLATPFDIYSTLLNVLHFDGAGQGDIRNRSISLFKEIPSRRTCADAGIHPHWCACNDVEAVNVSDRRVVQAASAVVEFINRITEEKRDICSLVKLEAVLQAVKLRPNTPFLKMRRKDNGGVRFSYPTPIPEIIYQLKLRVEPGAALYDVTSTYEVRKGVFTTRPADISRINRYAQFAYCVEKTHPYLRKYCFCREKAPTQ